MATKKTPVNVSLKLSEKSIKEARERLTKGLKLSPQNVKSILANLDEGLKKSAQTFLKELKKVSKEASKLGFIGAVGGGGASGGGRSGGGRSGGGRSGGGGGAGGLPLGATKRRFIRENRAHRHSAAGRWRHDQRVSGEPYVSSFREQQRGDFGGPLGGLVAAGLRGGVGGTASLAASMGSNNFAQGLRAMLASQQALNQKLMQIPGLEAEDKQGRRASFGVTAGRNSLSAIGGALTGAAGAVLRKVGQVVSLAVGASEARLRQIDAGGKFSPAMPGFGGFGFTVPEQSALGIGMAKATGTTTRGSMRSALMAQRLGVGSEFPGLLGGMAQTGANVQKTQKVLTSTISTAINMGLKKGRWRELFVGFNQLAKATPLGVKFNLSAVQAMAAMLTGVTGGKKSPLSGIRSAQAISSLDSLVKGGGGNIGMGLLAAGLGQGRGFFGAFEEMQEGITGKGGFKRLQSMMQLINELSGGNRRMGGYMLSQMTGGQITSKVGQQFLSLSGSDPSELKRKYDEEIAATGKTSKLGSRAMEGIGSGVGAWRRVMIKQQKTLLTVAESLKPFVTKFQTEMTKLVETLFTRGGALFDGLITSIKTLTEAINITNTLARFAQKKYKGLKTQVKQITKNKTYQKSSSRKSFISDVRLKRNIEEIIPSRYVGVKEYSWDWTEEAKFLFSDLPQGQGVLAQEVVNVYPSSVSLCLSGYLEVDYSKIPLR